MKWKCLYLFPLAKLDARLGHAFAQHIVDQQTIESLFTPFLKFDIFKCMAFKETGSVSYPDFGSMKPKLFFSLKIRKL